MKRPSDVKRLNRAPMFYVKNTISGNRGRNMGLQRAIDVADRMGIHAMVYKLGTCTNPVHIGTYD